MARIASRLTQRGFSRSTSSEAQARSQRYEADDTLRRAICDSPKWRTRLASEGG